MPNRDLAFVKRVRRWWTVGEGPELSDMRPPTPAEMLRANLRSTWRVLLSWAGLSLIALILHGAWNEPGAALRFAGAAGLLAAASASVGGLLGFLFGIPRSLQQDTANQTPVILSPIQVQPQATGGPAVPVFPARLGTKVNTNLEQISDWLTKILVGVGLTQLQYMWPNLRAVSAEVAGPLSGNSQLALLCIINFCIWGFFAAYLMTRLFLASAFGQADVAAERIEQQEHEAFVLTQRGAHSEAAERYASVFQLLQADSSPDQRRRAVEGWVYNLLYEPPPEGFRQAIQVARRYLADASNPVSAKLWAYLAAAHGQEYAYERAQGADPATLARIEAQALDAVRRALEANPALKPLLRSLWDPNDPLKASTNENDLEVFHSNPAFRKLLE